MPVLFQKWITRADLRANPDRLYVFGDNEQRIGTGGQAKEMRGEPNAVGIRTKASPGIEESAYWHENTIEDYDQNIDMIEQDLQAIDDHLIAGGTVVFPEDGIGTGLAQLEKRAPDTLQYIQMAISELAKEYPASDVLDVDQTGSGNGASGSNQK